MTRPMSLIPLAPSSALIASIAALVSASPSCWGRNSSITASSAALGVGQFLAAALLVEGDQFAALLGHLLQDFDDQGIVVGNRRRGAQFDVAVLELGENQAHRAEPGLVADFIAATCADLSRFAKHACGFPADPRRSGEGPLV